MEDITLAIIAKNESDGIRRAVESAKKYVDKVIISVDDSSTDDTYSIAVDVADEVYKYTWSDDFSAARNQLLDRVSSKWVLILDGHEYIESFPCIDLAGVEENVDSIQGFVRMENGSLIRSDRLLRSHIRYVNSVHNLADVKTNIVFDDFVIVHDRSIQSLDARRERDRQRDDMIVRHLSGCGDARSIFYLGQQHMDMGRWSEAIDCFKRYLEVGGWSEEIYQAKYFIAKCLVKLDSTHAIDYLDEELKTHYYLRGNLLFHRKEYPRAVVEVLNAIRCKRDQKAWCPVPNIMFESYHLLSLCFFYLGERELAGVAAMLALSFRDDDRIRGNINAWRDN